MEKQYKAQQAAAAAAASAAARLSAHSSCGFTCHLHSFGTGLSDAWNDTGGKAVSFINQHKLAIGAIILGTVIVASVICLSIVTAGGADAIIGLAAASLPEEFSSGAAAFAGMSSEEAAGAGLVAANEAPDLWGLMAPMGYMHMGVALAPPVLVGLGGAAMTMWGEQNLIDGM